MERTNQLERTRAAIVAAAHDLADSGAELTMPAVAAAARVSEATAYRHFPDLVSLLRAVVANDDRVTALLAGVDGDDPVERIGQATEILARAVLRRAGAVRAVVAATVVRPSDAKDRPVQRFALIEAALGPWVERHPDRDAGQLVRDLAVVVSAESLFTLTDLCGLAPDDAVASLVATARRITEAEVSAPAAAPATGRSARGGRSAAPRRRPPSSPAARR